MSLNEKTKKALAKKASDARKKGKKVDAHVFGKGKKKDTKKKTTKKS